MCFFSPGNQGTSETRMPKILLTSSTEFQLPEAIPRGTETPRQRPAGASVRLADSSSFTVKLNPEKSYIFIRN